MNAWLRVLVTSLAASLLGFVLSGAALAQVPDRVGRIAYLSGDVQFYSESAQAWVPAQVNAPVSSRNSLYTGSGGRAEVRFGSTAVALDAQTQLDIQLLDDSNFKAGVPRGSISLRVPRIEDGESYEVMAPAASYSVLQAGRFRVDATDGGSSVTVLAGLVNAAVAGGSSVMVEAGQALSAADGGFARSAARGNALDRWAAQRDDAYRASQAERYVSPNMTGYEELDANGRWASDPDYGNVWYPTTYVRPGWVPYRDGHWAFVAPWGWTWIDDAPWGFAPFHYGRWVLIGARWAWMPGTYVRRPSYAPALVGFIGGNAPGGSAISISIGTQPAVGWYPLPPWERYRPAYAHHDRYVRNINNFTIVNPPPGAWRTVERQRVSANQLQGATLVPREAFVASRPAHRSALTVPAPVLAAPPIATALPVVAPPRSVDPAPRGFRGESRDEDRGENRGENRSIERQPPPAIVRPPGQPAPQPAPQVAPPRVEPARPSPAPFVGSPGRSDGGGSRHEAEQRSVPLPAIVQPLPSRPQQEHERRPHGERGRD